MRLERIWRSRQSRLAKLLQLEREAVVARGPERERLYSYIAIESHNLWIQLCRLVYIQSCRGALTTSGLYVFSPTGSALSKAELVAEAAFACKRIKTRQKRVPWGKEPKWFELPELYAAFIGLGLANAVSVNLVLAAGLNVFTELAEVRNFAAHRNEFLAKKLTIRWGAFAHGSPRVSEILSQADATYPTVGYRWLMELGDAAELLVA